MSSEDGIDFNLPPAIRDFIFDLYESVRRSQIPEEVSRLYEVKLKEINDKYFGQSHWPDAKAIVSEVQGDELFLALYREMAMRHVTTKLKPQLADHLASWQNYKRLFELLIQARDDYLLTTQWIYDITQEFAYQFQGFCQFRSQHSSQNPDTLRLLQANKEAWTLPAAVDMLAKLVRGGRVEGVTGQSPMSSQLAYFATIELARLECLIGDHSASLNTISRLHITERNELFATLPICMFNVYYHIAVCHMLSKAHASALDVFSDIILYVLRILKPGAGYTLAKGVPQTLHRMLDKALHLTALLLTITPSYAVDDQVRDAVNSKCEEKMRRLRSGEKQAAVEMWESNCPKFISPLVDYGTAASAGHSVFELQSSVLIEEVMQHVGFIKLRSYLSMYASVDIGKLARIMEVSEGDLVALLLSYKHKYRGNRGEVDFHIDGDVLVVQSSGAGKGAEGKAEKFFVGGVRKHEEISRSLKKTFASLGL